MSLRTSTCRKVAQQICQQNALQTVQRRQIASSSTSFAGVDIARTSDLITSSDALPPTASRKSEGKTSNNSGQASSNEMVQPIFGRRTTPFPYRLHAQCTKHNTILNLTRSVPESALAFSEEDASSPTKLVRGYSRRSSRLNTEAENQVRGIEKKLVGSTVLRTSCGGVGFKKGQRSSFEAATRATNKMLELIGTLGTNDRKRKNGTKIRDPEPTSIDLVLKGYGPGREAVIGAIQSGFGDEARKKIWRIIEATPVKIGGTRPRKRRMLSPPLDLSRRR